jgi:DNA replication protein DnaC
VCERYVDAFLSTEGEFSSSGLLLIGRPGTGKSHLAAAVLSELIGRYGVDGRFVDFTTLVHDIQSTFDRTSMASKHQILDPVMNAEVLVLDELAAQKPSAWVNDTLYLIMNGRYTRKLPTLFTTEYPLDASDARKSAEELTLASRIPARLVSRLHQMATPIVIEAGDFRREIKVHSRRS